MNNTWGVFEEWKNGLLGYADKAKDKIYGEKMSVEPGQDTMRRTEEGYLDKSLKYAGGKIDQAQEAGAQYFQGEKVFDPATGGPTKRTGAHSSKSMEHFEKGLEKTSKYFHKGTKYAVNKFNEKFDIMFPEFAGKKVSENESDLIEQIKNNQKDQLEAGHHGVPLSVYKNSYFFGQDRFDDLVNELKKDVLNYP